MNFESYLDNLKELKKWYKNKSSDQLNEADTRFHLINELFIKCLGWEKEDIKNEEAQGSEYADYTFYLSARRAFILEAKKETIGFTLPAGFDNRTEYKLSSLIRGNEEIRAAVNQVIGYCNSRGVEFAAISNGHQLIAFLAHRSDGVPPIEGKAIVFKSLEIMERHFVFLWQMLSKHGIAERRLAFQLQESEVSVLPLKLSATIDNYPKVARRNELQTDLQIVSELILENVNKAEDLVDEFLRETYCNSGTLSQYALVSKSILNNRYSLLFDENLDGPAVKDAVTKKGLSPEIFGESLSSRPILLLGDVGAGKSMFINYFINIEANEIIKKSFTIYVDLGSKAALAADLKEFFMNELLNIFLSKYDIDFYEKQFVRGVYNLDLLRFSKGIHGDLKEIDPVGYLKEELKFLQEKIDNKVEHIKNCLNHITKGWKRQVIIFMDNVDQRDEHVQEHAFLISNEVATSWPVTIFLTLRPTTYYKSKKEGALTGYHPKAFTISPPRIEEVIYKRLNFALKIAKGEVQSQTLSTTFELKLHNLTQFLEILLNSFKDHRDLVEFIDNVCNGNVRKAIEYLAIFIGSGHINTKKILASDSETLIQHKRYTISIYEFIRAIIYRDHMYYYPDATDIANIFDVTQESREHFLAPILLDYLLRYSGSGAEGFLNVSMVTEFLQDQGFKFSQIEYCILKSIYKGLIETEARKLLNTGDQLPQALRITTTGSYHLQRLINTFVYCDAVLVDTPIMLEQYREMIKDEYHMKERIKRGLIFIEYLDKCWEQSEFKKIGFDWFVCSKSIRGNIEVLQQSWT